MNFIVYTYYLIKTHFYISKNALSSNYIKIGIIGTNYVSFLFSIAGG